MPTFIYAFLFLLFAYNTGISGREIKLPDISNRGTAVKTRTGKDLIGVSGMARVGDYVFLICEANPALLYFGKFEDLCRKAIGFLDKSDFYIKSIPIIYTKDIGNPLLGAGKGFEAVEFRRTCDRTEIYLSYEADLRHYLYKGILKFADGIPEAAEISERFSLPDNPEIAVHNAGWEGIAYDPDSGEIIGVFENRMQVKKMAFHVDAENLSGDIKINLPPVQVEYRITDLTCVSEGNYLASAYIWKESYQNLAGDKVSAPVPQFRIFRLTLYRDHNNRFILQPELLNSFKEEEYKYGSYHLNIEGIAVVKEEGFPKGILVVNDNDPPYIKFGRKEAPPSIVRFLLESEYNPENK